MPAPGSLTRWLTEIESSTPLAVVLGGDVNALSFARSLGRRRVPTLLVDTWETPGLATRFARNVVLDAENGDDDAWLGLLEEVGAGVAAARPILFPTSDAYCGLVARHEEALRRAFRFLIPSGVALERILDKRAQYGRALEAGIPIPRVWFPESLDEARGTAREAGFPCMLKPYVSHEAREQLAATRFAGSKVVIAQGSTELETAFAQLDAVGVRVMVQEVIPGDDTALLGYLAFWDAEGRERAAMTKRKLRQFPPGFGDGAFQVSVDAPRVVEASRRLLEAFDVRGFVAVEYKLDPRDGSLRLIEINPRTVSGNQLAIAAGLDLPWIGYRYLASGEVPAQAAPPRAGVTYMHEEWDLKAFLALRRAGRLSLGRWLWSLRRVRTTAIWARDDPAPMIRRLRRALGVGSVPYARPLLQPLRAVLRRLRSAAARRRRSARGRRAS